MGTPNKDVRKELARFVLEQVKEQRLDKELAVSFFKELTDKSRVEHEPIAIVGMACRFPEADTKEAFWDNLVQGRHSMGPFPRNRREDLAAIDDGKTDLFKGGFLDRVDQFDHEYFRIPPAVARRIDPYQRLLMEVFVETIEDAGYSRSAFHGRNVGVFAGNDHTHRLFNSYLHFIDEQDFTSITGSWTGVLASRISYLFNFKGPAVVVDTACSSGLVALDCAIKSIRSGDCEVALVGAANLFFAPGKGLVGEIENDDPQVRAFDKNASGTVWGEGVAAIMVKSLSSALRDGDPIHAVVKGLAINNDGASNGITAPNAKAQQDVILKAWERAGIHPDRVSYIETHGTGTKLGDPIEIKGLTGAFAQHTSRKQFCGIGSVKTNIGHTVGVAGLASVIKVLLGLKHDCLPPSISFDAPNTFIDFCDSPVYLVDRPIAWKEDHPRAAGVSSFSLNGTNCHIVLEEGPSLPIRQDSKEARPRLMLLSARSPELLTKTLERWLEFLAREGDVDLGDLCFTAALGREHHPIRIGLVASTAAELRSALLQIQEALQSSSPLPPSAHCSLIQREEKSLPTAELDRKGRELLATQTRDQASLLRLAEMYACGANLKWEVLYEGETHRRISCPAQPFKRERCWDKAPGSLNARPAGKTDSSKTDQTELDPVQVMDRIRSEESRITDLNDEEEHLPYRVAAYIWTEVLGYPRLASTDDFYALGGDSITGMRVVHIFNSLFGLRLSLSDLLSAGSLKNFVEGLIHKHDFARALRMENPAPQATDLIQALPPADSYPLSRAQKRMFLLERMTPGSTAYNVNAVVWMQEKPDLAETEVIVRQLLERHESLRTAFEVVNEEFVQIIHKSVPFSVEYREVPGNKDPEEEAQEIIHHFIRPFDLTKPPLMRMAFVKVQEGSYYLVIDMHHIITDGASMGVLVSDYLTLAGNKPLAALPCQYKDFAAWQNQLFASDAFKHHADYWREKFADGAPPLEIQTDFPRPTFQDFKGSREFFTLDPALTDRLRDLARSRGTTLFTVLLAAFKALLYRTGGGADLSVGTPVTGRNRLEAQSLIGMFVNTLVLRDHIKTEDTFASLLDRVRATTLEALDHQDFPYEELVEVLNIPRIAGRNPLFDVYFVLQNEDMGLQGLKTLAFDGGNAKFDMTVVVRETSQGLLVEWEYATALFKPSTIRTFGSQFSRILASVADHADVKLRSLDLMGEEERRKILETWNDTTTDYPAFSSISALFESLVEIQPKAIALRMDDASVTYGELNARSNRLAHFLLAQGVRPGEAIGLCFDRSFAMIEAIMAVLKAGCAYVPLDPENPEERSRGILEDCQARFLLAGAEQSIPESWKQSVHRPEIMDVSVFPETNPGILVTGENLAYIIFTSGSTGRPKGTLIRHKSVIRVVRDTNYVSLSPADIGLMLSSYAFDGSVFDLFGALLNGGQVVLISKRDLLDVRSLAKVIQHQGVTVFFITTALVNTLIDLRLECLSGVRHILFGGELVSYRHVARAFQALGPGRLIHMYGPTETTVFATAHVIQNIDASLGTIPIGKPLSNTSVYVLDEDNKPVPVGVPGELYIGGDGLATGYLHQEDLTRERFIENPFVPGESLYRSGDLVKWLDDGTIQFIGRRDHQVKIRGFRIELGEIETAILQHPEINACLVTADSDSTGRKQICAYIVPADPERFSTEELRGFLSTTLPDYMVPAILMPLAAFPLNANGKIDRNALPAPVAQATSNVSPRTEKEGLLVEIWRDLLGVKDLGIHDNFFSLGGDSIKAIQAVARLQALGLDVEVAQVFQYQTVAALALHIEEGFRISVDQSPVTGNLTLNPIQRWFLESEPSDLHHFHQSLYVALDAVPETDAVQAALANLCAHHDALRTVFTKAADRWEGKIEGIEHPAFCIQEWTSDAWAFGSPEMNVRILEVQTRVQTDQGPLVSVGVFRTRSGSGGICLAIHHLVVDVVSWGILLEDFQLCLQAAEQGLAPDLPAKTASFQAWNEALQNHADSPKVQAQLPYWLDLAKGSYGTVCPKNQAPGTVADGRTLLVCTPVELSESLMEEANRAYHTEPQHLLLCALGWALSAWRGKGPHLLNLESHGRDGLPGMPDAGRSVGWFTAAFPFPLTQDLDPRTAIKITKETLRSMPSKGLGFGLLSRLCTSLDEADRQALRTLSPQVGFNFLGSSGDSVGSVRHLDRAFTIGLEHPIQLPLDLVVTFQNRQLMWEAFYDSTRISASDMGQFTNHLQAALEKVASHCLAQKSTEKTASDFTSTRLQQEELEDIFSDLQIV